MRSGLWAEERDVGMVDVNLVITLGKEGHNPE